MDTTQILNEDIDSWETAMFVQFRVEGSWHEAGYSQR